MYIISLFTDSLLVRKMLVKVFSNLQQKIAAINRKIKPKMLFYNLYLFYISSNSWQIYLLIRFFSNILTYISVSLVTSIYGPRFPLNREISTYLVAYRYFKINKSKIKMSSRFMPHRLTKKNKICFGTHLVIDFFKSI